MQPASIPGKTIPDPTAPPLVPSHVPDMTALPFLDSYRILKAASPEVLRSYCSELENLPPGPRRNTALSAFFKTLIQVNPTLTKDLILELKKDERWLPLSAVREAALPRGMEAVAEVLLGFDRIEISGCSYDLLRETLDEWGKTDPLSLKQFLETHRGQDVEGYFDKLVGNWAAYDPEAAREWMENEVRKRPLIPNQPRPDGSEEIFDGDWRSTVEGMAVAWIQGFLTHDPDAAITYVLEHAENEEVKRTLFWFASDLFRISPERTRDFVSRLSGELQTRSLEAAARVADPLVSYTAKDNTTSPRYVAEWLLQFSPEAWQAAIPSTLRTWESANPKDLFAWMADLPTETRAGMVRTYPAYTTADRAQEDFEAIMQTGDRDLRMQLLEKLMRAAKDAEAAMRIVLENADLPSEHKSHLARLIPTPAKTDTVAVQ